MASRSACWARAGLGAVAALCAASAARAEEFSWQIAGGASVIDAYGPGDSSVLSLDATYYLDPIDDAAGPLSLASFLSPKSRISISASRVDGPDVTVLSGSALHTVANETTDLAVSGRYVLPKSRWYTGGTYMTNEVEAFLPTPRSDPRTFALFAGRYLGANTTLEATYGSTKEESSASWCLLPVQPSFGCATPFAVGLEMETRTVDLEVFHVWRGTALSWTISGSVAESSLDVDLASPAVGTGPILLPGPGFLWPSAGAVLPAFDPDHRLRTYRAAGEVFPTARLGVRLGYTRPDAEGLYTNDGGYDLAATWFFKPRVGVQFSFAESLTTIDSHVAGIRLIGRF